MHPIAVAIAALSLLVWIDLLAARGGFWREPQRLESSRSGPAPARRIVAVIPARDEADVIGIAVTSLLRQSLAGSIHVVVVDDGSRDGTAAAARAAAEALAASARLTVIAGTALPPGWTGKLWALSQGIAAAGAFGPDYLLLTDADIEHAPQSIDRLVASAESSGRDLVSRMVRLSTATLAERLLIPAFVFFFFMLYPPAWIASRKSRTAGAAGGCMLVRPQALERIGGLASVRSRIIDDCALAGALKAAGSAISLGLTRDARSIRSYGSFAGVGRMISRTAFSELEHSYLRLAVALAGLAVTFFVPPLLLAFGDAPARLLGGSAWLLMSVAYRPMVRFYGFSTLLSALLPAVAAFYAGATLHSAIQYRLGRGGQWKSRIQDRRV